MAEPRDNMRVAIVGGMQTGKSHFTKHDVIGPAIGKRKVVIIATIDHKAYSHIQKIPFGLLRSWCQNPAFLGPRYFWAVSIEEAISALELVCSTMDCNETESGLVILEDSTKWLRTGNNQANPKFETAVYNSRNLNIDLFLQAHSLSSLPKGLAWNLTHIVLFITKDVFNYTLRENLGDVCFQNCQKGYEYLAQYKKRDYQKITVITENE